MIFKYSHWFSLVLLFICIASVLGCTLSKDAHYTAPVYEEIEILWRNNTRDERSWIDDNFTKHKYEIGPNVFWDDSSLQSRIGVLDLPTPLTTERAITEYAWKATDTLVDCGYLPENYIPIFAFHFTNGVWEICYADKNKDRSGMRDGTIDVYLSEEDGHIILVWYPGIYAQD